MSDWTLCPNCSVEVRGEWRNLDGTWDGPEEQRPHKVPRWGAHDCPGTFDTGAAVAFGLLGMAEAIRARQVPGVPTFGYADDNALLLPA